MNLSDAAAARGIAEAIDAALAAFSPMGINTSAIAAAYPSLARASIKAKELYSRIIEAYPIVVIENNTHPEESESAKEDINDQQDKEETGEES